MGSGKCVSARSFLSTLFFFCFQFFLFAPPLDHNFSTANVPGARKISLPNSVLNAFQSRSSRFLGLVGLRASPDENADTGLSLAMDLLIIDVFFFSETQVQDSYNEI